LIGVKTYLIVGGGLAGACAAEALRGQGFDGRIVLVGDELDPPYQRPPLSKEWLLGKVPEEFPLLRTSEFYQKNAIELQLGDRVTHVDWGAHHVRCASGAALTYDKLLIVTGGAPRRLRSPGAQLAGIHYLRTWNDSRELRKALGKRSHVLVVGAGFIGCEVAASAKTMGCDVTIVDPLLPMTQALGPEVGAFYADYHRKRGAKVITGASVAQFRGKDALEAAVLSNGEEMPCELAVVGIGIVPVCDMLAGVDTRDGLITDEFCRTQIEDVFAAGDVAKSWRPRLNRSVRLEHFDNAQQQGAAAARSMCGKLEAYDPIPFFWSDQYDLGMQYYGSCAGWDEVVLRGQPAQESFIAFYVKDGRIDAACLVNRTRDAAVVRRLLGKTGIDASLLGDDNVALKTLVPNRAAM
jgi:3-phenylpropionate/trans-cinnamate dioxygenase ferredoxin reductase subunit